MTFLLVILYILGRAKTTQTSQTTQNEEVMKLLQEMAKVFTSEQVAVLYDVLVHNPKGMIKLDEDLKQNKEERDKIYAAIKNTHKK